MELPRDRVGSRSSDRRKGDRGSGAVLTLVPGGHGNGHAAPHRREVANGAGAGAGGAVPVRAGALAGTLRHHLRVQSNLCAALEALADGLPAEVRGDNCLALARSIYPIVHRSHVFEERELFPFLKAHCADEPDLDETLDRLHGEHWEDEAFAEEVHHELIAFAADRVAVNVEKLSYMLRGFFTGVRRHLAFESEHVLPMLGRLERC